MLYIHQIYKKIGWKNWQIFFPLPLWIKNHLSKYKLFYHAVDEMRYVDVYADFFDKHLQNIFKMCI